VEMRRACKVDDNQGDIVKALRALGWHVIPTHQVGQLIPGFADLIAAKQGVMLFVEVKMPGEGLRPEQLDWMRSLERQARYTIVRDVGEAQALNDWWEGLRQCGVIGNL
jgi:hypothetical protein